MWSVVWLVLLSVVKADQFCRALALEGGGSLGAYQVGVMIGMTEVLPGPDIEWNVVTGISTGALNSAGVSHFPMGQETEMAQFMKNVWLNLNSSKSVFVDWNILGPAYGLIFEPGMYNTAPLRKTLEGLVTTPPQRNVTVGSTNLNTGKFGNFNESLGMDIIEAVMCSAAPPLFFPPQHFQNTIWADGGCICNLDVFSAIERCLDVVPDESQIIVDMIFCSGAHLAPLPAADKLTVTAVQSRVSAVKSYDSAMWFVYNAMNAYPQVNYRYIIVPSAGMPGGLVPLDFDPKNLEQELTLGTSDAHNVIQNGLDPKQMALEWKQTRYNKASPFSR